MATVSVIIRAFNEAEHLAKLLAGLSAQTVQPTEIILVDSGSSDDTVAIAESGGCKIVTIRKEQFSFGRSLNYGCEAATGDILLIVSAHVFPIHSTYLENILAPFVRDEVSIVYGRQVGDSRTKFSESRIMLKWFPEESIWDQGHPFSNNANAAVRRDVWEKYRYDETLTGLEDLELANRVLSSGGVISYVADAAVVHVHEETWATIQNRYRREAIAYKTIVAGTDMSAMSALRLGVVNTASDLWHAARTRQLRKNLTSIPRFRAAQFFGAWQGFRTRQISHELLKRFYYPADAAKQAEQIRSSTTIDYAALETAAPNATQEEKHR